MGQSRASVCQRAIEGRSIERGRGHNEEETLGEGVAGSGSESTRRHNENKTTMRLLPDTKYVAPTKTKLESIYEPYLLYKFVRDYWLTLA